MLLYVLLALTLVGLTAPSDPAASLVRSKTASRQLDCTRLDVETGSQQRPGQIAPARPRGDFSERSAVVCQERLVRSGLRAPQDEAILYTLDQRATALAATARSLRPDLKGRTWLVEAHYPDSAVAGKISFATKNALVAQGLAVSDRTPILGVDDVAVITRLPPEQAYAAACQRYFANGSLDDGHALLAVVSLDRRETLLHAGVCSEGQWTWLK